MTIAVQLGVKVNGGAPQTGRVVCSPGDSIQPVALATAGITDFLFTFKGGRYPSGWATPAGYVLNVANQDIYLDTGASPTATAITLPAAGGVWGKWEPILQANGDPTLIDATVLIEIVGPGGTHDLGYLEMTQGDAVRAWVGDQQKNLRLYDGAAAGILTATGLELNAGSPRPHFAVETDNIVADNSWHTILVVPMPPDTSINMVVDAWAHNTGASGGNKDDCYGFSYRFRTKRVGAAAPVRVGAAPAQYNQDGDAGENAWDLQWIVNGTNDGMLLQAKGIAGHTLREMTDTAWRVGSA